MSGNSSSDEEDGRFQTNLNLDFQKYQKHKRNRSNNFVKAGKKIVSNTKRLSEQKPALSQRQSFMSGGSSLTNDSSGINDEISDDDSINIDVSTHEGGSNLPNFHLPATQESGGIGDAVSDLEDGDDNVIDANYNQDMLQPEELEASDSDDEDDKKSHRTMSRESVQSHEHGGHGGHGQTLPTRDSLDDGKSHTSKTSRNSSIRRNIFRKGSFLPSYRTGRGETDITDQADSGLESGSHFTNASHGRSSAIFKDILRKVALTDQQYPERGSPADSFIGRILDNEDSQGLGLGGGGLAPGASRQSTERDKMKDSFDEEEEMGYDNTNEIELQKLDFASLNNEARNLINVHVPHSMQQPTFNLETLAEEEGDPTQSSKDHMFLNTPQGASRGSGSESSTDTIEKEKERARHDNLGAKNQDDLYAPNPDLFLRGDIRYDDSNEFVMLDNNSEADIAPPSKVQAGVLSSLLKLYQNPDESKSSSSLTYGENSTLNDFDEESRQPSHMSFHGLKDGLKSGGKKVYDNIPFVKKTPSTNNVFSDGGDDVLDGFPDSAPDGLPSFQNAKPKLPKKTTIVNPTDYPSKMGKKIRKAKKNQDRQLRITVHITNVLQRQRFIMLMCKALMLFGAPTHRLEEYMIMTSRVLEIDGQFIYLPGCMIIAFGDAATRTSEVHLVKCSQGVNLSKLSETHKIYKAVIHDLMGAEEAAAKLTKVLRSKNNFNPWLCVFFYGLGSSCVCPFAFGGGWVDIPIAFGVGLCVGYLQFFVSSMSNLYSSVFEVTSSIVVSFIARAIGSINGGQTFCFSAIAQGSLALILPGYIILCGSLELQSRNLVAGSVRMFYAIIYSLFLGFGITLGAALYGWVDSDSVSETSCPDNHAVDEKWRILFVPAFTCCLGLINQADFRQLPIMVVIAACGYVGNFFAGKHFHNVTEFTASIGAFIIGILGNLYSRIGKGLAVSAMLPAIFVQVPSGIASQSSLLSGVRAADQITGNDTNGSSVADSGSLSFGATMVEVSIGISVGLFAAALFVYPFGKKRTGLFSL